MIKHLRLATLLRLKNLDENLIRFFQFLVGDADCVSYPCVVHIAWLRAPVIAAHDLASRSPDIIRDPAIAALVDRLY